MKRLKTENMKKCFSLLREFIDEAQTLSSKKGIAIMALDQLQKVTGGKKVTPKWNCTVIPRAE